MYRVLWFDDEHEKFELDKDIAIVEDIQLIGFSNALEGIKELIDNHAMYDAIILDGKFYSQPNQLENSLTDQAFGQVAKEIEKLRVNNVIIPCFIYSGQKSFVKDVNSMVNVFEDLFSANGKIFDKSKDEDFKELLELIKTEADKRPITQARHNNPEIFKIFELGYLPESEEQNVLELLIKPLPTNNSELKAILVNIRSIHESCLIKLESIKVIPNSKINFRNIVKHLNGNPSYGSNWEATTIKFASDEIKILHEWIYFTCSRYIHYLEEQHYDGYMISNYAVESLRQGLLEILLWFKRTYEENK